MKTRVIAMVMTSALLVVAQVALADGMIVPVRPELPVRGHWSVKYHHVKVTVRDQVASVHIDQEFVNHSRQDMEVEYLFPIPPGAAIDSMTMVVAGKELPGKLMEAKEARKIYEEIVRKKNAGASSKAIASEFGLSQSRIHQIVNRSRLEKEKQDRSAKLLGKIRMFDDIDKKWPTETLINGLQFPWKAKQCLTNHFCGSKACEISLRDIMDFLITDYEVMPNDLYAACPAFQQKHVGSKTYGALIKYFSENDLGCVFGIEWPIVDNLEISDKDKSWPDYGRG